MFQLKKHETKERWWDCHCCCESLQKVSWWYESSYGNIMAETQMWGNSSIDPVISKLVAEAQLVITCSPIGTKKMALSKKVCDLTLLPEKEKTLWWPLAGACPIVVAALALRNKRTGSQALLSSVLLCDLGWLTYYANFIGLFSL